MEVAVVSWPRDAERLWALRAARAPRLVVVEQGPPPVTTDDLEDWLRGPPEADELRIRCATLRARAARRRRDITLEEGVLRVGGRVVVLPPIQARLAGALLERLDAVVGRDVLAARAWPGRAPNGRNVLDVHIAKLRRALVGSGVDVRTVHGRGYLMRIAPPAARSSPTP